MDDIWKRAEQNIIIHEDGRMNIVESIDRHADGLGKPALVFEDEQGKEIRYTYDELRKETNRFANLLEKLKVKKNSRIFIYLPKIPELYISFLGAIKQGSIAAPLFEALQEEGLELRLDRGDANVLVTNKELAGRLKHPRKEMEIIIVDDEKYKKQIKECADEFEIVLKDKMDTAVMMFTSSTAGTPVAGVETPHYGLVQQDYTAREVLGLTDADNYWCTAHPGWVTGSIYGIIAPLSIGCTTFVLEAHFDAKQWIEFIKRNKISVMYTAPTALRMLKPEIKKQDLAGIRNICSVGEALTEAVFDYYKNKLGKEIAETYWQTETGAIVIASLAKDKKKAGSMGKPIAGIEVKLEHGMITLKKPWPAMMTGIYKHPQMYKSYFEGKWFKTNDSARQDKEGYLFFEGRKDDMIKTSGERVSPIELESFMLKHPAVKEAAVIGIPDPIKGEIIKGFVVLNNGFEPSEKLKEEIKMFVKQNYAGHAYPKILEFIKELPKTNSGKIIRMKLRG